MAIHLIAAKLLEQSGGPTNRGTQQPPDIAISRAMLLALLKISIVKLLFLKHLVYNAAIDNICIYCNITKILKIASVH